ncbi:MAG: FecR family protein [Pseudomonadota bacterium]
MKRRSSGDPVDAQGGGRADRLESPQRRWLGLALPALLLGGLPGRAQTADPDDRRAEALADPRDWPADQAGAVAALTGAARAMLAERARELAMGAAVYVGDLVRTGEASRMTLALGARTTLRLGAATEVQIERYIVDAGGEISLSSGAILFDREGTAPGEPLTVDGAYGLIAVRGTRFFAGPSISPFGVFAARGSVSVAAGGAEVVLTAGEGTEFAAPGAPPSPPSRWSPERVAAALALLG